MINTNTNDEVDLPYDPKYSLLIYMINTIIQEVFIEHSLISIQKCTYSTNPWEAIECTVRGYGFRKAGSC